MDTNTRGRPAVSLLLTSVAFFMVALDALVVITALPAIHAQLGGSLATLEWTVNAYGLAFAAGIVTASALGDRFGRRRDRHAAQPDHLDQFVPGGQARRRGRHLGRHRRAGHSRWPAGWRRHRAAVMALDLLGQRADRDRRGDRVGPAAAGELRSGSAARPTRAATDRRGISGADVGAGPGRRIRLE